MNVRSFSSKLGGIALAAAFGLVVGGVGINRLRGDIATANPPASLKLASPNEGPSRNSFAPVVKQVLPEVVNISTSKVVKTGFSGQMMPMDPFFRQFFGDNFGGQFNRPRAPQEDRERSLGSGVIVSPEGYILTNNHVVTGATEILVTSSDKHQYKARVVGTDPKTDLAVLKVDATNLPAITIADSSKVQVGDYALAIGDPFGVGETVTMGIVSATGRANLGIEDYEDFIQTDAPINPGNSGGALVNDRGELIGINTAILSHGSGGNEGVGFAIPSDLARNIMDQIVRNGRVTRAYMGAYIQGVSPELAKAFGETAPNGALVGDVEPGSPAARSGLEKGDIIVALNGKPVTDSNQARMSISMMAPGTTANLKVWRNGSEHDLAIKLGEMPTENERASAEPENPQGALEGVTVENVNDQTAQQLGLPAHTKGVVVTEINPSSPVADSGLQQGDVIQEVNHQSVTTVNDFERAVEKAGKNPLLLVNRQGHTLFVAA
ncbi:MAG: DegQ family serine endoprotease [Terriglobia bacterium]|jgi:serine protease Do